MSIKKTIHYLWLSDEKPKAVDKCLDSWKKLFKEKMGLCYGFFSLVGARKVWWNISRR